MDQGWLLGNMLIGQLVSMIKCVTNTFFLRCLRCIRLTVLSSFFFFSFAFLYIQSLADCYASIRSHTWCFNLLADHVDKGFAWGDHTSNNGAFRTGGMFVRDVEQNWMLHGAFHTIDLQGLRNWWFYVHCGNSNCSGKIVAPHRAACVAAFATLNVQQEFVPQPGCLSYGLGGHVHVAGTCTMTPSLSALGNVVSTANIDAAIAALPPVAVLPPVIVAAPLLPQSQ